MLDVEELYSKTVSRLSPSERLRLASLIMDGLAQGKEVGRRSALDLLDTLPQGGRLLKSPAKAYAHLREERDSWDR